MWHSKQISLSPITEHFPLVNGPWCYIPKLLLHYLLLSVCAHGTAHMWRSESNSSESVLSSRDVGPGKADRWSGLAAKTWACWTISPAQPWCFLTSFIFSLPEISQVTLLETFRLYFKPPTIKKNVWMYADIYIYTYTHTESPHHG